MTIYRKIIASINWLNSRLFTYEKFVNRFVVSAIILIGLFWFGITYFQYQGFAYQEKQG